MKVLVTGGTGFVGREIVRALHLQHDVHVLARDPKSPAAQYLATEFSATIRAGSIFDDLALRLAVHEMDAVIHLVGIIAEYGDATFEKVHVKATENVIRAMTI